MKTENDKRREDRKHNDIVVKAKNDDIEVKAESAEHKEVRKPMEKAEEAEHTGTLMNMRKSLPVMKTLR